jgi:hypothetical protein
VTWENLSEGILEAFTEHSGLSLSDKATFQDGLVWSCPVQDAEERKNYDRWYMKHVFKPLNPGYFTAKSKDYYHNVIKRDPVKWAKLLERKRLYIQKDRNPEGYKRKLERNRLRRAATKDTPEWQARNAEYNRRRREKRALEVGRPVDYERGRGRPRKTKIGTKATDRT